MGNKRYSDKFKEQVVKEYLDGSRAIDITTKYEINKTQLLKWTKKWQAHGSFPDGRGKRGKGKKPPVSKINTKEMTKDEYIAYLEMELDILKYIAFLERKKQK